MRGLDDEPGKSGRKNQDGTVDLKSLLLCSDDKIVRVLRRTLGDLEISVEHCTSSDIALRHLTRERFEAIIVDCACPVAAAVLLCARTAPCKKRSVSACSCC